MEKNNPSPVRVRELIFKVAREGTEPSHLGASLSIVEVLCALYELRNFEPGLLGASQLHPNSSAFILSKGHAYLGLLALMCDVGELTLDELLTYQSGIGSFGAHPVRFDRPWVLSSNGSLGHGLSLGLGLALSKSMSGESGRVFVLIGDGECSEGSILEIGLLAPTLSVSNIAVIIDNNGFSNDGEVVFSSISYLQNAFSSFGWQVNEVDGHSVEAVVDALKVGASMKPLLVIANTIKGKGLVDIEGTNQSHHMKLL